MKRVNLILSHENYIYYLKKIQSYETNREFCKHDLNHFIDVARIAYILSIEQGLEHTKEEIYAAALLHDIGKWKQYEAGIPHELASAELALEILKDCNFHENEIIKIISAIKGHRNKNNTNNSLDEVIYRADKLSRSCYICSVKEKCYWTYSEKNLIITY